MDRKARITTKPLVFNYPEKGQAFTIPPGQPCVEVDSIKEARARGYLPDEQAVWAAKTNLRRGYHLVWLQGKLRGVAESDIKARD